MKTERSKYFKNIITQENIFEIPVRGKFSKQDYNKAQTIMEKVDGFDIISENVWVREDTPS